MAASANALGKKRNPAKAGKVDLSELAKLSPRQRKNLESLRGLTASQQRQLKRYAAAAQRRAQQNRNRTPDSMDRSKRGSQIRENRIVQSSKHPEEAKKALQRAALRRRMRK